MAPYQTIIYIPGSAAFFNYSSDHISDYYEFPVFTEFLVKGGRAIAFPVYYGTFERNQNKGSDAIWPSPTFEFTEFFIRIVKDFQRTVDYLVTRNDIDSSKLGLYGMSWGGVFGPAFSVIDRRIKVNTLVAAGVLANGRPEVNIIHFLRRLRTPTLIINGQFDSVFPPEIGGPTMYQYLGLQIPNKKIFLSRSDHIPNREDLVQQTVDWFDKYLGPVDLFLDQNEQDKEESLRQN